MRILAYKFRTLLLINISKFRKCFCINKTFTFNYRKKLNICSLVYFVCLPLYSSSNSRWNEIGNFTIRMLHEILKSLSKATQNLLLCFVEWALEILITNVIQFLWKILKNFKFFLQFKYLKEYIFNFKVRQNGIHRYAQTKDIQHAHTNFQLFLETKLFFVIVQPFFNRLSWKLVCRFFSYVYIWNRYQFEFKRLRSYYKKL